MPSKHGGRPAALPRRLWIHSWRSEAAGLTFKRVDLPGRHSLLVLVGELSRGRSVVRIGGRRIDGSLASCRQRDRDDRAMS